MPTFRFPAATVEFLTDLRAHNDKAWFDANRARYESGYIQPATAFVEAISPELQKLVPGIHAEPWVRGSIFRINRDIRFSSDKRPYKDHLDFWFWEGDRKSAVSGLFLRVWPDGVVVGAGAHGFDKGQLEAYRDAVGHTTTGAELAAIVDELEAAGHEIGGETYKRVPRGYAADGIGERLLRHSALYVHAELPLPPQRGSSIPRWVIGALSVASTAGLSPMSRGRPGVLSARVHSGQRVNSSPFGP